MKYRNFQLSMLRSPTTIMLALFTTAAAVSAQQPSYVPVSFRTHSLDTAVSTQSRLPSPNRSLVILPAGAATAHYGFFCKQELRWDKALPFQLRIRAGAPADCDRLEGKRRD